MSLQAEKAFINAINTVIAIHVGEDFSERDMTLCLIAVAIDVADDKLDVSVIPQMLQFFLETTRA